jgi:hypothetical protein
MKRHTSCTFYLVNWLEDGARDKFSRRTMSRVSTKIASGVKFEFVPVKKASNESIQSRRAKQEVISAEPN